MQSMAAESCRWLSVSARKRADPTRLDRRLELDSASSSNSSSRRVSRVPECACGRLARPKAIGRQRSPNFDRCPIRVVPLDVILRSPHIPQHGPSPLAADAWRWRALAAVGCRWATVAGNGRSPIAGDTRDAFTVTPLTSNSHPETRAEANTGKQTRQQSHQRHSQYQANRQNYNKT